MSKRTDEQIDDLIASVAEYYKSHTTSLDKKAKEKNKKRERMRLNKPPSLSSVAEAFNISTMKARKILITSGVYESKKAEEIKVYHQRGMSVEEIHNLTGYSAAVINSFLPYEKGMYSAADTSSNSVRIRRHRDRVKAVDELKNAIECGYDWRGSSGSLWTAVALYQNYSFTTNGRGRNHTGAVEFTFQLKISSRTGEPTEELIISTRDAKTITRSSVELALERYLSIQDECGYVKGPKAAGQIFGASYLYAIFIKWGVIRSGSD